MNTSQHQLVLEPLDDVTWRLCDRRVPSNDAATVLACVERLDEHLYEVTWVGNGIFVQRFTALDAVLMAGVARLHGASEAAMEVATADSAQLLAQ